MEKRTVYFDYLRVLATIGVIILHVSAQNWYTSDVNSFEWQVFNFSDSIVRWSVPVFVMISGAIFLQRDIPIKKIYSKYIKRMVIAFIVWSLFYAIFEEGGPGDKARAFIEGHYHMWFVLMIIGIYMCIPIIKPIVKSELLMKYFLVLSLIFTFAIPEIFKIAYDTGSYTLRLLADSGNAVISDVNMYMVLGYVSYFILGYYLNNKDLSKKMRYSIYLLGLLGFVFTIVADAFVSLKLQQASDNYYSYTSLNVLFEALSVFVLLKYRDFSNEKFNQIIKKLSEYSFGAYLVHVFVLDRIGITTLTLNPVISIVIITVGVFVISFLLSGILHKIPVAKNYIV